jgi:hypothetical protein
MPRECTICTHSERAAIDQAIVADTDANRRIAAQYGVSETAIRRHAADHIPATLAQAQEAQTVAQADDLLLQVKQLRGKAVSLLLKAEQTGDIRTALLGIREARSCMELLAKLQGQLDERPVVNILVLPEWERMRGVMLTALAPYPEARLAVAAALRGLDAGQ